MIICFSVVANSVKHLILILISYVHLLFNEMFIRTFYPILIRSFVLLTCKSSLCILNTSPLADIFFANIFSLSVAYHVIFKVVSWEHKKKSFILTRFLT